MTPRTIVYPPKEPKYLRKLRDAVKAHEAEMDGGSDGSNFMDHIDNDDAERFRRFGIELAATMDCFLAEGGWS